MSAFFLSLAIFTKGVAGLFLCPSILVFIILEKRFKEYLYAKSTYLAIFITVLPLLIYLTIREYYSSGYINAVWEMEFVNRYLNGDGDSHILNLSFLEKIEYYWGKMYDTDFNP